MASCLQTAATRPVARNFERGVLFDQKWTFTCMMINKGTETGCAKHTQSRGVWGHAPPENFLKTDTKRLNLVAFQSIKITIFLGKLKTSCMNDIWKNISTATVIIPSAHACV